MKKPTSDRKRQIPESLRAHVEVIFSITDPFCAKYLDAEYGELVRRLVAKLARKKASPLLRGDLRIWAAAAIHTVGSLSFLFDKTQNPHMTLDELRALTACPNASFTSK